MRLLFLSQVFPYPPDRGDRIKAFNLVKHLGSRNSMHLVSFFEPGDDLEGGRRALGPSCASLDLYPAQRSRPLLHLLRAPSYLWGGRPFFLRRYAGSALERDLPRVLATCRPDVCHLELLGMALYRPALGASPIVMGCSDALHLAAARDARLERHLGRRFYLLHQARALRAYERTVLPTFDRCVFVGPEDLASIQALAPGVRGAVIPNGVDVDSVRPLGLPEEYPSLVFTGYMGAGQNLEAVEFFCEEVLPRVRQEEPAVRFLVVGRDPAPRIRQLARWHSFSVTGAVPDVRPYLDRATVYVCPVRGGTGFKNRLAEAMAMGKAIVATRVSAAGLEEARDGEHLLLADEPGTFAAKVVRLLRDADLRRRLGAAARSLMEASYRWEQIARRYESVYEEAVAAHRRRAAGSDGAGGGA